MYQFLQVLNNAFYQITSILMFDQSVQTKTVIHD